METATEERRGVVRISGGPHDGKIVECWGFQLEQRPDPEELDAHGKCAKCGFEFHAYPLARDGAGELVAIWNDCERWAQRAAAESG